MLLLLAFLPAMFAQRRRYRSPSPEEVPKAFLRLYEKCNLQQYVPKTAIGAKIWSVELDPVVSDVYAVEYDVDFDGGIRTVSRIFVKQFINPDPKPQGIWSHDLRKVGLFIRKNNVFHFFWSNNPFRSIALGRPKFVNSRGLARTDYVYTIIQHDVNTRPQFVRWKADLTGGIEILGTAPIRTGYLQFIEPHGPFYYLQGQRCHEISQFSGLRLDINLLNDCDHNHGVFTRSKFETIYGMTLFAFLTKDCPFQIYGDYWTHALAKIQFISPPTTTTATTTTTTTTTTTVMTTTPLPTTVPSTASPTRIAFNDMANIVPYATTEWTENAELVTSSDNSTVYIIIISVLGVLCICFIISVVIALGYRRMKEKTETRITTDSTASNLNVITGETLEKTNGTRSRHDTDGKTETDTRSTNGNAKKGEKSRDYDIRMVTEESASNFFR